MCIRDRLPTNIKPTMKVKVPPTVIECFILAKQPIKIELKLHLIKLKQLLAVDAFLGYKSTNKVVDDDKVLMAQKELTQEVINMAGIFQPLSALHPNNKNEMTAMKF